MWTFELLRASRANRGARHSSSPAALQASALVGVNSQPLLRLCQLCIIAERFWTCTTQRSCWSFKKAKTSFVFLLFSSRNMSTVRILICIIANKHAVNSLEGFVVLCFSEDLQIHKFKLLSSTFSNEFIAHLRHFKLTSHAIFTSC